MAVPNVFAGNLCQVIWGSGGDSDVMANLTSWTAEATTDFAEATPMGPADDSDIYRWKTMKPTFTRWTASADGLIVDASDTSYGMIGHDAASGLGGVTQSDLGGLTDIRLRLHFSQTNADGYLEGSARLVGLEHSADANDIETISYSFTGSGPLLFKLA